MTSLSTGRAPVLWRTSGFRISGLLRYPSAGRQFSLSLNVDRINVPLLIQAADREFLNAIQTAVTWKVAGKPIEMFVFPDEHHVKWHPAHRFQVYTRNVDWFAFWLKGEEDPDPAKAEQYARWRKLRTQHEAAQRDRTQ